MWRTVRYSQAQCKGGRRRDRNLNQWDGAEPSAPLGTDRGAAGHPQSATVSGNQISALVKDLRRAAHALRYPAKDATNAAAFFFRDILWPAVRACLESRFAAEREGHDALQLRLVGLGIGPFSRRESRSSFLQMATLVALRDSCVDCLAHLRAMAARGATTETERGTELASSSSPSSSSASPSPLVSGVRAIFFEPLAVDALHGECCRRLGVEVEAENRLGVYSARMDGTEVVLLYMPHCPWVLLHNSLLANWPTASPAAGAFAPLAGTEAAKGGTSATAVLPLRNVVWIANDLRNAPLVVLHQSEVGSRKSRFPWTVTSPALHAVLTFTVVFPMRRGSEGGAGRKRKKGHAMAPHGAASEDREEVSAGLFGFSRNDIEDALLDTAVMSLADTIADVEVRETLTKEGEGKSFAIIKKAPELFDGAGRKAGTT